MWPGTAFYWQRMRSHISKLCGPCAMRRIAASILRRTTHWKPAHAARNLGVALAADFIQHECLARCRRQCVESGPHHGFGVVGAAKRPFDRDRSDCFGAAQLTGRARCRAIWSVIVIVARLALRLVGHCPVEKPTLKSRSRALSARLGRGASRALGDAPSMPIDSPS